MLYINIAPKDGFDEKTNTFTKTDGCTLCLEHSLVSISKWEAKWHKPFLGDGNKTDEELRSYIKCMTITQNVKDEIYSLLSTDELKKINDYIGDVMTATTFSNRKIPEGAVRRKNEIITSELIYYWMVAYQIPFECQRWHLNRLLTLIKICSIKNDTSKNNKMSRKAILSNNAAMNAARRKQSGSKG